LKLDFASPLTPKPYSVNSESPEQEANLLPLMATLLSSEAIPELQQMLRHEQGIAQLEGQLDSNTEGDPLRSLYSYEFEEPFDVGVEPGADIFE